ncbi:MAG: matrixin family metalloprotease, partial [Candidatus Gastranaerophilales bacterium]|nr:matrixin family metalloprotease [Candidatus Gastranaerophilales bacterium]
LILRQKDIVYSMRKYLLLAMLLFICYASYCANYNVSEVNEQLKKCHIEQTSQCYLKLYQKYNLPIIRYCYAQALANEKQIIKAKSILREIIQSTDSKSNAYILSSKKLQELNALSKDMYHARGQDRGDYYNELKDVIKWQNPASIKVYFKGKTGKESILKNAFAIWDRSQGNVRFITVYNENQADITCTYTERLDGNKAGITHYEYITNTKTNKKYFKKARIKISLNRPGQGGLYTNSELLSITLHEIGHAVGIASHSDNINDIMYYSTQSYRNATLSHRDINTVRKIYAQ